MPRFAEKGLTMLREAEIPASEQVLEAVRVGCTDEEVAALLGMTSKEFATVVNADPLLQEVLAATRAGRVFEIRQKIHEICLSDEHMGQTRLLREVYLSELQKTDQSDVESEQDKTWVGPCRKG